MVCGVEGVGEAPFEWVLVEMMALTGEHGWVGAVEKVRLRGKKGERVSAQAVVCGAESGEMGPGE